MVGVRVGQERTGQVVERETYSFPFLTPPSVSTSAAALGSDRTFARRSFWSQPPIGRMDSTGRRAKRRDVQSALGCTLVARQGREEAEQLEGKEGVSTL
jgi:hypothetical protein